MALDKSILTEFAKVTNDNAVKQNPMYFGTIAVLDDKVMVLIDGSSSPTPVSAGMICRDGDRVLVEISNRTAKVINNMSLKTVDDLLVDGTVLSNAIEAKNLKISGGKIEVETSERNIDSIKLKYSTNFGDRSVVIDPYGGVTVEDDSDSSYIKTSISSLRGIETSRYDKATMESSDVTIMPGQVGIKKGLSYVLLRSGGNSGLMLDTAEIHGELFSGIHPGASNYKHCNINCDCTGNAVLEITVHTTNGHVARFIIPVAFVNATTEFTTVNNRKLSDPNNIIPATSVFTTSGASARARVKVSCTEAITFIHVKDMRGNALLRALSMATS